MKTRVASVLAVAASAVAMMGGPAFASSCEGGAAAFLDSLNS